MDEADVIVSVHNPFVDVAAIIDDMGTMLGGICAGVVNGRLYQPIPRRSRGTGLPFRPPPITMTRKTKINAVRALLSDHLS